MTLLALFFYLLIFVASLCLIYLAARLMRPLIPAVIAIGSDTDSLRSRVLPTLAFLALLAVLLKLTIF